MLSICIVNKAYSESTKPKQNINQPSEEKTVQGKTIAIGMTKNKVLEIIGEPNEKSAGTWKYIKSPEIAILNFQEDKLNSCQTYATMKAVPVSAGKNFNS